MGFGQKDGNEFIYIKRITDDIALSDVYIYRFAENRQLQQVKHANTATYQEGKWILHRLTESAISENEITTVNRVNAEWQTNLTPDKLGIASLRPTSLSISGLSNYITFLRETGQESKKFELTYWRKLFQPLCWRDDDVSVILYFWTFAQCDCRRADCHWHLFWLFILCCQ